MHGIFGYALASELPLTRTRSGAGTRGRIEVRRAALETRRGELVALSAWPDAAEGVSALARVDDGRLLLSSSDAGDYLIDRDAMTIGVDPDGRAFEHRLLSAAVPLLLTTRGDIALHAACVAVDDRALVFLGPSGAGKSTLAAALARRGHAILAEDGTVLDLGGGTALAWPGPTGTVLDPRTEQALGRGAAPPATDAATTAPLPVRALVLLKPRALRLSPPLRLAGATALAEISGSLIHAGVERFAGSLARAAELLRAVPLYGAALPDDLDAVSDAAERLIDALP